MIAFNEVNSKTKWDFACDRSNWFRENDNLCTQPSMYLNRPDRKIITAEDPVEYSFAGINQCQVRDAIGLTFSSILRSMLRQAPNVILIGEIRDREVADIAIQAALTGHLVFSTLHTNDAPSAITRLIDMGVKPYLVASSIQAIMAQRLIRLLCDECKAKDENPDPNLHENCWNFRR